MSLRKTVVFTTWCMFEPAASRIPFTFSSVRSVCCTDIQQQTERTLENVKGILEAAGSNMHHVVKTTVFLKDINDFSAMNEVYAKFFALAPPARSTVEVARLPKDALVEIEVIASS